MPEKSFLESLQTDTRIRAFIVVVLIALALFLFVEAFSVLKSYRYIGSGVTATNTITVSGEGEVFAVPDTATFSVSVIERAKDVETAQTAATKKGNAIIAYLKEQGIEEKDIQTTDYNVSPQYEYQSASCPRAEGSEEVVYCPPGKSVLTGFEVSQTLTVKVRDTEKAGGLLSGVGSLGASSVSGLSFTVADEDLLQAQARDKAITDAKQKAESLAKSLGVSAVRVVGFSENGNYPYYYAKAEMSMAMDARGGAAPSPALPVGQNKIISNVTITYEIR